MALTMDWTEKGVFAMPQCYVLLCQVPESVKSKLQQTKKFSSMTVNGKDGFIGYLKGLAASHHLSFEYHCKGHF